MMGSAQSHDQQLQAMGPAPASPQLFRLPLPVSASASLTCKVSSQPLAGESREAERWGKEKRQRALGLPAHPQGALLSPECPSLLPLPTRGLLTTTG